MTKLMRMIRIPEMLIASDPLDCEEMLGDEPLPVSLDPAVFVIEPDCFV